MIQKFTGHSSYEMSKKYIHVKKQIKLKAIKQFEDYVRNGLEHSQSVNKTLLLAQNEELEVSQYVNSSFVPFWRL
jgi:hypothetical protein